MAKVKVHISAEQTVYYHGTIEMEEEDYEEYNNASEDWERDAIIGDHLERLGPSWADDFEVDVFDKL